MLKDWSDAKRNIFEHIILSASVFLLALFWDHLVNLFHAINIHLVRGEVTHYYEIGHFQMVTMALASVHFFRKVNEFRYYGNLIPESLKREI